MKNCFLNYFVILLDIFLAKTMSDVSQAQTSNLTDENNSLFLKQIIPPPSSQPSPEFPSVPSLPKEDLLPSPSSPITPPSTVPSPAETIYVTRFIFTGNTIFSDSELASKTTTDLSDRTLPLSRLLQVASDVAKLYAEKGYSTSGAVISISEATLAEGRGEVEVQVIEGELEKIEVLPADKFERLKPSYLRSRLKLSATKPLNINRLQEALQLLQLNPLIKFITAELSDGSRLGTSILTVKFASIDSFQMQALLDNNRSPSVGSFRRMIRLEEANVLGFGDSFFSEYRNTDGSNDFEAYYDIPFNSRNGKIRLRYRTVSSIVIEPPFDQLDIESDYQQYELTLRQPILQTPRRELALGLTVDRQQSANSIEGMATPLSPGNNLRGRTRISTLRFFQEWLERKNQEVLSVRSSFNLGVDWFGTTEAFDVSVNPYAPESQYFTWRGQVQWVRLLAPNTLLLWRTDIQLSQNPLIPIEQFSLGGFGSVRGYAQNTRLTDSGLISNLEFRLPIWTTRNQQTLLQIIPFIDVGIGWNVNRPVPSPETLTSVGLGLLWQQSDVFSARIDWGIPLINLNSSGESSEEKGLYFFIIYSLF